MDMGGRMSTKWSSLMMLVALCVSQGTLAASSKRPRHAVGDAYG